MTTTIVGKLADEVGAFRHQALRQGPGRPEVVNAFGSAPAGEYRARQAARIPLELDHAATIGEVRHLERTGGCLWMVAEVHAPLGRVPSGHVYLSPSITFGADGGDIELHGVSLVAHPATFSARAVRELPGTVAEACGAAWRWRDSFVTALLEHARDNKAGTTRIMERTARPVPVGRGLWLDERGEPLPATRGRAVAYDGNRRPVGPMEYRPAVITAVH